MVKTLVLTLVLAATAVPQEPAHDHASPERMAAIAAALNLRSGATVADIGAGGGDYTVKLAALTGARGRVLAVDINESVLTRLKNRVTAAGLTNVEVITGAVDDPRLPANSLDAALIVNAYHEMTEYKQMLAAIRAALKPGGRLVILEPITAAARARSREDQAWRHQIAPELVLRDLRDAGFDVIDLEDPFTKGHGHEGQEWIAVAVPSQPAGSNR